MTSATIITILVGYLMVLLAIGIWSSRESGDLEGYYVAGKRLPSWTIAFSSNAKGEGAWLLCRSDGRNTAQAGGQSTTSQSADVSLRTAPPCGDKPQRTW